MRPTLLPTLALASSMTTRVSILQGSQLPTLVPKFPTVDGTAMPTLIPAVSSINFPDSMERLNSTYGLQELSSLYPSIDWSSLPTYSIMSDASSLTSVAQNLPTFPTSVPSIESTEVLDALPSSFVTEMPGFTVSGPDSLVFDPPVINYDPEKPLDEIIVNIRGHLNCTNNCTSAPSPVQNLTNNGEGSKSIGNFSWGSPFNLSVPQPTPTTPCAAQVPQPTKFCHPEHCHNGHCHEKHCHKQSEVDELRKADLDWIWSPTSADDDESRRLGNDVDAFSPLTMITLPRPTATPLAAAQNVSTAAQIVDALESRVKLQQQKSRGHHHHHHRSHRRYQHHHHHVTRASRLAALRPVTPPRLSSLAANTNNSATAAAALPSSALRTSTTHTRPAATTTSSRPFPRERRQLPVTSGDDYNGMDGLIQSLMSTSTLPFDPSSAWWPATHLTPDPILRSTASTSTSTTPKVTSSSSVSPTAKIVYVTFVSSYTSSPVFSPPTLLITLTRRAAMSSPPPPSPASPVTTTPALRYLP